MPERKPFGRPGPPKGYPKSQDRYADPLNWRYPVHTPFHARAARRYFDEWPNRSRYEEDERWYIDARIEEALKRFGIFQDEIGGITSSRPPRKLQPLRGKRPKEMTLDELLMRFLGQARFKRAKTIKDAQVKIHEQSSSRASGQVKEYTVKIDRRAKAIIHNCEDWRKGLDQRFMCKHLGKFMLSVKPDWAVQTLRDILDEKSLWSFKTPA